MITDNDITRRVNGTNGRSRQDENDVQRTGDPGKQRKLKPPTKKELALFRPPTPDEITRLTGGEPAPGPVQEASPRQQFAPNIGETLNDANRQAVPAPARDDGQTGVFQLTIPDITLDFNLDREPGLLRQDIFDARQRLLNQRQQAIDSGGQPLEPLNQALSQLDNLEERLRTDGRRTIISPEDDVLDSETRFGVPLRNFVPNGTNTTNGTNITNGTKGTSGHSRQDDGAQRLLQELTPVNVAQSLQLLQAPRFNGSSTVQRDRILQLNASKRELEQELERLANPTARRKLASGRNPDPSDRKEAVGELASGRKQAADVKIRLIQLKTQVENLKPDGAGVRFINAFNSLIKGFGELPAGMLDGIATTAKFLDDVTGVGEFEGVPAQDLTTAQLAQGLRRKIEEVFPTDPALQNEFFSAALPAGLGSFLGFAGGGIAARAVGGSSTAFATSAAGLSGAGQAYRDAKAAGASEDDALLAGAYGYIPGVIQVLPVLRVIERFNKASKGQIEGVMRRLAEAGKTGSEEAVVEGLGQVGFNLIAKNIFDDNRELFRDVGGATTVGGAAGFLSDLIVTALGRRAGSGRVPTPRTTTAQTDVRANENISEFQPEPVPAEQPVINTENQATPDISEPEIGRENGNLEAEILPETDLEAETGVSAGNDIESGRTEIRAEAQAGAGASDEGEARADAGAIDGEAGSVVKEKKNTAGGRFASNFAVESDGEQLADNLTRGQADDFITRREQAAQRRQQETGDTDGEFTPEGAPMQQIVEPVPMPRDRRDRLALLRSMPAAVVGITNAGPNGETIFGAPASHRTHKIDASGRVKERSRQRMLVFENELSALAEGAVPCKQCTGSRFKAFREMGIMNENREITADVQTIRRALANEVLFGAGRRPGARADARARGEDGGARAGARARGEAGVEASAREEFPEFARIVDESSNAQEAFERARQITDVSPERAGAFRERFDPDRNLTQEQAFERFFEELVGDSGGSTGTSGRARQGEEARSDARAGDGDEARADARASGEFGEGNRIVTRERAEELKREIQQRFGQLSSGLDPKLLKASLELAVFHIEGGVRKFGDFASVMIRDVGERIKPYLRNLYKSGINEVRKTQTIEDSEISSTNEIAAWEGANLTREEAFAGVADRFEDVRSESPKRSGRPDLANRVNDEDVRRLQDTVDQIRTEDMQPSRRSDEVVFREADRRPSEDYNVDRERLFNMAEHNHAGNWTDVDVRMARMIMEQEGLAAIKSGNRQQMEQFAFLADMNRQKATEMGRAFRQLRDETKSPQERQAEFIGKAMNQTTGIIEAERLAKRIRDNETEGVREELNRLANRHIKGTRRRKRFVRDIMKQINGLPDGNSEGFADAVNRVRDEILDRLNLPRVTDDQFFKISGLIDDVTTTERRSERNAKLLELLELLESDNIRGGELDTAFHLILEEILKRRIELINRPTDLVKQSQTMKVGKMLEAMMLPPKSDRRKLEKASLAERKRIYDEYLDRFEAVKRALKKRGIDLDSLTDEDLNNPVTYHAIVRSYQAANANLNDKIYEFYLNSVLSGPTTQVVNLAGASVNTFVEFTSERWMEAAVNQATGDADAAQVGELAPLYKAFVKSMPKAWDYAKIAWETEHGTFAEEHGLKEPQRKFTERTEGGTAIGGTTGRVVRAPIRGMLFCDEFSKITSFYGQLASEAYREGKKMGLEGRRLQTFIEQQIDNPSASLAEQAWGVALEQTFQQESGTATKAILSLRRDTPGLRWPLLFVTTPGNLLRVGFRKSPLGVIRLATRAGGQAAYSMGLTKNADWVYNKKDFVEDAAEQILAWGGLTALAVIMANQDDEDKGRPLITGSGTIFRNKSRFRFEQQNIPAQSIKNPFTGEYISYRRFEPISTQLAVTVDMLETLKGTQNGKEYDAAFADFVRKQGSLFSDKSYLKPLGDFTRFMADPTTGVQWVADFTTGFSPNLIKQVARSSDRVVRDFTPRAETTKEKTEALGRRMIQRGLPVPFVQPPARVDWLGRQIEKDDGSSPKSDFLYRLFVPAVRVKPSPDVDINRIILNWNNQNPDDIWFPSVPNGFLSVDGERVRLTDEEYFTYTKRAGELTRELIERRFPVLEPHINNPRERDLDLIKKAVRTARQKARIELIREGLERAPGNAEESP